MFSMFLFLIIKTRHTNRLVKLYNNILLFSANIPKKIEQLGVSYTSINTRLPGGPPIWITISPGTYHDAFYVNNARLLASQSNIIGIKSQSRGAPVTQVGDIYDINNNYNLFLLLFADTP